MLQIEVFPPSRTKDVINLILPIQQKEFGVSVTIEDQPDLLDIPNFYQKELGIFWIATFDARVIGSIALKDIGNQQVALRKMFVSADFRGAEFGVAKALLSTVVAWCRQKKIQDIFLGTTVLYHAAHRFYEKNHFVEIVQAQLPASFPIMQVDTKFYWLNLLED